MEDKRSKGLCLQFCKRYFSALYLLLQTELY